MAVLNSQLLSNVSLICSRHSAWYSQAVCTPTPPLEWLRAKVDCQAMPAKRKLKRHTSKEKEKMPVITQKIKCIKGGVCKRWQVLDTEMHMGVECAKLGTRQPWLHILLAGRSHKSPFHGAITNFIADCVTARMHDEPVAGEPAPLQDIVSGNPTSSQMPEASSGVATKGRGAIFDDNESESEVERAASSLVLVAAGKQRMRRGHARRKCNTQRAYKEGFSTFTVRGMELKCVITRGPKMLVPVDSDDLGRIINHLGCRSGEPSKSSDASCNFKAFNR